MSGERKTILYWPLKKLVSYYRADISPRKGFKCAYNVVHGGGGCSDYFLAQIECSSTLELLKKMKVRFGLCKKGFHSAAKFPGG